MKYLSLLALIVGLISNASANIFKLECLDSYDGKTRLALIEIDTDAATVQVYSETDHDWRSAVNVSLADATISFVERGLNDQSSATTSVTINRANGKYFAYTGNSARKDGQCKKVP
jgi:hypothetical protein